MQNRVTLAAMHVSLTLVLAVSVVACGSDSAGELLVDSSLVAEFKGASFVPKYGVAQDDVSGALVVTVGTGEIDCSGELPPGYYAVITLPTQAVTSHEGVLVSLADIDRASASFVSSNQGTVEITASSEVTVSGSISFLLADSEGDSAINGTFEVTHCSGEIDTQ